MKTRIPFQRLLPALFALSLAVSCDRPEPSASPDSSATATEEERARVVKTGTEASEQLMQSLGGQLKGALQSGGPVEAIRVCQQIAMPLTSASVEGSEVVAIRRTTLKPRNPANAPDPMDRDVLDKMAAAMDATRTAPEPVVEWQPDTARYYQPIMIQEVCLNCHGDPAGFTPELSETLAALYPEDRATGYEEGDFRGVIRVDIERN